MVHSTLSLPWQILRGKEKRTGRKYVHSRCLLNPLSKKKHLKESSVLKQIEFHFNPETARDGPINFNCKWLKQLVKFHTKTACSFNNCYHPLLTMKKGFFSRVLSSYFAYFGHILQLNGSFGKLGKEKSRIPLSARNSELQQATTKGKVKRTILLRSNPWG